MGVTEAADALKTIDIYCEEFTKAGLEEAFERVIALVLELGVEFHCWTLDEYDRKKTAELTTAMHSTPFCIEGHSTDYQTRKHLRQMCEDGVAILKVGPAFTFAAREALFSLELIERELLSSSKKSLSDFRATLDRVMCENPKDWEKYYLGSEDEQSISRAYSYYDRGRYYFGDLRIQEARDTLMENISDEDSIPLPLLSQYLPAQYERVRSGHIPNKADEILLDYIGSYIDDYLEATTCMPSQST
jgi:D-tagatose-1,6-bisphosphate aldolase subunit GatZ/KbaZ